MRKFTTFITGLILPLTLSAQTLPKGMTDLTSTFEASDSKFALTVTDDRTSVKTSNLTLTKSGSKMFFTATSTAAGNELYVTDGTVAGTKLVKDINPGTGSSNPSNLIQVGDSIYFSADDGTNGSELWVSDGTAANTKMVADVYPGGEANSSAPTLLTNLNGKVLFWGTDVVSATNNAKDLYIYDPATQKATQISTTMALFSGDCTFGMSIVLSKKNLAFFTSDPSTPVTGEEVWVTNGTAAGTKMLKDVWPGTGASGLQWLVNYNDSAVVWREQTPIGYAGKDSTKYTGDLNQQIWVSDGTSAGTHLLKFLNKVVSSTGEGTNTQFAWAKYFPSLGGMLFRADDGVHGVELCFTDASTDTSKTHMLYDINVGSSPSWPEDFDVYKGYVCFDAQSNVYGAQPSYWDPASKTVKLMQDIHPGGDAWAKDLTTVQIGGKDSLLYAVGSNATSGNELFVSRSVGAVGDLVASIYPGGSSPNNLRAWQSGLYFTTTQVPKLFQYSYIPVAQINPVSSASFDDSNWNDTLTFIINKKQPTLFTTLVIKAELLGKDSSFRISATKNGTYGFSLKTSGHQDFDTMYIIAGKYLNPDSFLHNVVLRLSTPKVDTAKVIVSSMVDPSFRYDLYYNIACGDTVTTQAGVSLGKYNSIFDQAYGADPVTGKNWGYSGSGWNMANGYWGSERENDGAPSDSIINYTFAVDNGTYEVWVGYVEFWSGSNRSSTFWINKNASSTLTYTSTPQVIKQQVVVTDGKISVNAKRINGNTYMCNIRIGLVGTSKCYSTLCTERDSLYATTKSNTIVNGITTNQNVSLYPNPSNGQITLKAENKIYNAYEVYDLTGKLVVSGKIYSGNTIIDLRNQSEGVYLVKTIGNAGLGFQKVIIKK
jgi:ELWxxDGT repeat protein